MNRQLLCPPPPTAALSERDSHQQDALPPLLRPGGSNFHEAKTVPAERSAGFLEFSNFPKPDKEVEEVDGHEGAIVTAAPLSDYMETTNPSQCTMHVGELLINSPDAERCPTDSNSVDDDVENSKPDPNSDITLVEATCAHTSTEGSAGGAKITVMPLGDGGDRSPSLIDSDSNSNSNSDSNSSSSSSFSNLSRSNIPVNVNFDANANCYNRHTNTTSDSANSSIALAPTSEPGVGAGDSFSKNNNTELSKGQ